MDESSTHSEHAKPKALVLGATGLIGGLLVRKLLASEKYEKVYAVTRHKVPLAHSHLENIVDDMNNLGETLSAINVDDVYCCLGTTMKKAGNEERFKFVDFELPMAAAESCRKTGARHFLVVSAIGANRHSMFFYNRVKGELEHELKSLGYPYLTIIQPSLLLGSRDESRLVEQVSGSVFSALKPLMVGMFANIAPIKAEDVADRMLSEAMLVQQGVRAENALVIESGQILSS